MPNAEQLERLRHGGVNVWNMWREGHPDERPNLREANLTGADLSGANLSGADLSGADLSGANLSGCDLTGCDLTGAYLTGADLSKANLREVNLTRAYLSEAHLREANLTGADLSEAHLREADLSEAHLREASLTGADLSEAHLPQADLSGANLSEADLSWANLSGANLSEADLSGADLWEANLSWAKLREVNLSGADLRGADLSEGDLSGADLREADLKNSTLVGTDLKEADLAGCRVYGISAWDVHLDGAKQVGLVITPGNTAEITVDNLQLAQFIYLLLNNENIRHVIDTITSKVVLILGRFTPERKAVLDALRDMLRTKNYSPVVFDFEKPVSRNLTETIRVLAGMARFVIADITDAKSIPQELMAIVPDLPSVPVQPLLLASQQEYGMFEHFRSYPWVLSETLYDSPAQLISDIESSVIAPAESWLEERRAKA